MLSLLPKWYTDAVEFSVDQAQRAILFADVMRERGNGFLAHEKAGKPPVLVFDYDIILDGRQILDRPVNYALAHIKPRDAHKIDPHKRPIVVIDPRAGHGPGIGGSKEDSEIGLALAKGHPTYFILFFPEPVPGQTLSDVEHAQTHFLEEIVRRHPKAEPPALIGNCQAGWAAAMLTADRPELAGPIVLAGAPLSYWSGVAGSNPMRYKGGLLGGTWLTSMLADLGAGKFDGAHLVWGFEDLNPANTFWKKHAHVYENIDTEPPRFLDFERWWGGFYFMNAEEIRFIVDQLFVGNNLEQGELTLDTTRRVDLKRLDDPVVVFASRGDNITPPQQALNWIAEVFGTTEEIKRQKKVLVYLVHEEVGHLGIFVSSSVARKEHKEILGSVDQMRLLPPGLYEMVINPSADPLAPLDHQVRFLERGIEDIMALDDGRADEVPFARVAAISRKNDELYRAFVAPWLKAAVTPQLADWLRWQHPLRQQRWAYSDLNPLLWPLGPAAAAVKADRRPVAKDNPFWSLSQTMSGAVAGWLDFARECRDSFSEQAFRALYCNPWMDALYPDTRVPLTSAEQHTADTAKSALVATERQDALARATVGGFGEAIVRIMTAVARVDRSLDSRELTAMGRVLAKHKETRGLKDAKLAALVADQSQILDADNEQALAALAQLLPTEKERRIALAIAQEIAAADSGVSVLEQAVVDQISQVLGG